jgi:hypothetical protein
MIEVSIFEKMERVQKSCLALGDIGAKPSEGLK